MLYGNKISNIDLYNLVFQKDIIILKVPLLIVDLVINNNIIDFINYLYIL